MSEIITAAQPDHAEPDHPKVSLGKVGVLIANLGTPDATDYWSMRRYLNEFLSDRRVIDYSPWLWQPLLQLIILSKRPKSSGEAYRSIWNNELNESPLLTITRQQAEKLSAEMSAAYGDQVVVDFCMRYGNPSTDAAIRRLKDQGCDRIVFFPLYPQYSAPTTATANDHAFRTLMKMTWQPAVRTVPAYYDHPLYIEALARSIETAYAGLGQKTTRLLRERLGWSEDRIKTTFQSKFGPEDWLQPYTVEEVARLAAADKKSIAVIAPAFSSDCVETLEEINEEIKESFEEAGGTEFTYIPCLNDSDDHIRMMMGVLEAELAGWVGY
jgi:ferrochelatase